MAKRTLKSKEYFRQVRTEQKLLWAMEQRFSSKYMECMPSAIRYDLDKVQISPRDALPERFAKLDALEEKIKEIHERLAERRLKALELVEKLENADQQTVMTLYYLTLKKKPSGIRDRKFYSWDDIADIMGYSCNHVQKIHGTALLNLEKQFFQS